MAAANTSKSFSKESQSTSSTMPTAQDPKRSKPPSNEAPDIKTSPPRSVQAPPHGAASSDANASSNSQSLRPPRRPQTNTSEAPDYFSGTHSTNQAYQSELNPFEAQFGNPSSETPGKIGLPGVAALTSPQPLGAGETPGWSSLRCGPLSPAMLAGPQPTGDYFDSSLRGFPTPNESSLRTGLTPGGTGSVFPLQSPNTQLLFNQISSGAAPTPGTMDFINTSNKVKAMSQTSAMRPTSQPLENQVTSSADVRIPTTTQAPPDPYAHPDADAANGLFMLAQANGARGTNSFATPGQPAGMQSKQPTARNTRPREKSPAATTRNKKSAPVNDPSNTPDSSESEAVEESKPALRSRGKKAATSKKESANNRRKAEETPTKQPTAKRAKGNNAADDSKSADTSPVQENGSSSKKLTDDEKRKNFLERNRVAALKCRQRKKQWLHNLQQKVELYGAENDHLNTVVNQLREQLASLKSILIAHKDCPVSANQGLSGPSMMMYLQGMADSSQGQMVNFGPPINGTNQNIPMQMQTSPRQPGISIQRAD